MKQHRKKAYAVFDAREMVLSDFIFSYNGHCQLEIFPTREDAEEWIGDTKNETVQNAYKIKMIIIEYKI